MNDLKVLRLASNEKSYQRFERTCRKDYMACIEKQFYFYLDVLSISANKTASPNNIARVVVKGLKHRGSRHYLFLVAVTKEMDKERIFKGRK